jgi:excisionase family DNA binding protein
MIANPCQAVCEPLLSVGEVAKLFGVHPTTLLRLARNGHLPGVKIGSYGGFEGAS